MSSKYAKGQEPILYQSLLDKNQALSDENQALKDEIESLKARFDESEELKRAISEGDLDALVIPGLDGELVFTLDSADRAYRVLVETMNEGTATFAFDGTILYCNRRFAELLNMPSQSIIGTSIYRFIAPESTVNFNSILKHKINAGEINLRAVCGRSLPVYLSISSLKVERSPNAWCLVVTDLTEQKKSEEIVAAERLARSIIEQAAETIVVCDASGRITRFSNSMLKLCECNPTFKWFEDLINLRSSGGADSGESILPISSALKGSTILGMEATFESNNRQRFNLLLNSGPLKNASGEIIGCVITLTDITERKKTEEKLRESNNYLQLTLKSASAGMWIRGNDGSWIATAQLNSLFGCSPDAPPMQEDEFPSFIYPDDLPRIQKSWDESINKGSNYEQEYRVIWPDGSVHWLASKGRVYLEADISRFAGITFDITDRKQMEEALRNSEERYRMLFTNMTEGFVLFEVICNEDGTPCDYRYLEMNTAYELSLGIKREKALGKPIKEAFPNINPMVIEKLGEVVLSGQSTNFEMFSLVVNKYFDINVFVPQKGKIAAIFRDITERKRAQEALQESEEQYRAFFENNIDAVLLTSADGTVYAANPTACRIFGMTEKEIIRAGRNGTVDLSDPRLQPALEERARTGKFKGELNYRRKDGTIFPGEVSTSFFKDKNGAVRTTMIIRDITERKRTEAEIQKLMTSVQQEKERLSALVKSIPDEVWFADNQKKITLVNPAVLKEFGNSTFDNPDIEVIAGNSEVYRPDGTLRPVEEAPPLRALKGEIIQNQEEIVRTPASGELRFRQVNAVPVKDAIGNTIGSVSVVRDITELKQAEEALKKAHDTLEVKIKERTAELEEAYNSLKESERSLAEAQEMAHIGSWDWDIVTNKMYQSDELYHIFRLNPQELDTTIGILLNYVHPDDRNHIDIALKEAFKGKPIDNDYRIVLADGEERIVHMHGYVIFDEKNVPLRMKGTVQDITEHKRAEEALKQVTEHERFLADVVENSFVPFGVGLPDGGLLTFNQAFADLMGYSREELIQKHWAFDLTPPEWHEYEATRLTEAIRTRKPVRYEKEYIRKGGTRVPVELFVHPVFDIEGNLLNYRTFLTDITERKKAEKALAKIDKIRIKEIHHRIKNNLQVISSLLDLQAEKFEDKKVREAFKEGQNRVISMSLIHEELYKGEGTDTLDFSIYLEKLAENLFHTYSLSSKNIRLLMDLEEDTFLDMDTAVPLGIIVNELVSNSLKHAFTEGEEGKIRIQLYREERNCDMHNSLFSLTISDDGKGLPEDLELESVESLGLQLVNILVEQLDGKLELKRNNGTAFTMRFTVTEKDKST